MTKHPVPQKKKKLRGQSSVEYILIIAAVVGLVMMFGKEFKTQFGSLTSKLFGNIGSGIDQMSK